MTLSFTRRAQEELLLTVEWYEKQKAGLGFEFLDREALTNLCEKWRIRELSLFGSAIREDFGPDSDVDYLVSFEPDAGWDLRELTQQREALKSLVGREVDMVVKEAIRNPYRREGILAHREMLHGA